jgi:MFS family permease
MLGFRGWRILGLTIWTQAFQAGLLIYGFGVVIMPFADEFGVSRQTLVLGSTLLALSTNLLSPFVGAYIDRRSIRPAMVGGALLVALGFLLLSRVEAMWQVLAIFALVLPLGNLLLGQLSSTTLMTRWFVRMRGRAMGISAVGTSIGGLVFPPLLAALIEKLGWSRAFTILSIGVALALVPAILGLVIDRPEDVGQRPDGTAAAGASVPTQSVAATTDAPLPMSAILGTARFWQIAVVVAFAIGPYLALLANLVPFASDLGIAPRQAAVFLSTAALIAIPGKLVFGGLADHLGTRTALWLVVAFEAGALLAFLLFPVHAGLLAGSVLLGLAGGGLLPLWGLLIAKGFGQASFGRAAGAMNPAMMPVTLLAAPLAGRLFDETGNYRGAFLAMLGSLAVSAITNGFLRQQPRVKLRHESG